MHDLKLSCVPAPMIELIWDKVEPLIDMVKEKSPDDVSIEAVKEQLMLGNVLLVTISRGADVIAVNVLEVRDLDTGLKAMYIPITAGTEMENWMEPFLELATNIGKDFNCIELRGIAVRKGWLRKLEPYGWEELFTTIRVKIGE